MFQSMANLSYRHSSNNLWCILCRWEGNVLIQVLPYAIGNCILLAIVDELRKKDNVGFSPTGHGLLTLLVSFLVINKVTLAYERFRMAREHTGNAFLQLRELMQLVICFATSSSLLWMDDNQDKVTTATNKTIDETPTMTLDHWKSEAMTLILQLIDATVQVIQHEGIAKYLAKHKQDYLLQYPHLQDPMTIVQKLRCHLYIQNSDVSLELLERITLQKQIGLYMESYRHLLDLASTPLPFALIQMGRAFLFLWTFSMPLVLLQGPFTDLGTAMIFLFFLTYGFVGLEFVSMKLASPFGDGIHDIQVTNLRDVRINMFMCVFICRGASE
jgi:predicted membrane chloride channel (bestrophin family)